MLDSFQLIGTSIEDRYRVDATIGEGGFGIVYKGHHERLDAPIAIKCLKIPGHFTADARAVFLQRFREEGKILVKLADAPGVPRVYDYGVVKHRGEDIPYLVLEWLDGQTLEDMLKARRSARLTGMRGPEALAVLLPAVDALAIAHEHQIAHRDIKPANMFLVRGARGPAIKVLDFGIAKAMQEGDVLTQSSSKTSTNFRAFTPNYAAPEQFAPKRYGVSGPWSDVHSLALILVELLTDQPGNKGDDFVECLEFATSEQRPSAQGRGAQISNELEQVIARALALKPELRFANAAAFAQALRSTPEAKEMPALPTQPMRDEVPAMPATERAPMPSGPRSGSTEIVPHTAPGPAPFTASPAPETARERTGQETAKPVSVTQPGAGQQPVPKPPPPPPASAAKPKGSALPILAGVGAAIAAGSVGVYMFTRTPPSDARSSSRESPSATASAEPDKPKTKSVWAADVVSGKNLSVVRPMSEAEAKGKFHLRIELEGERITSYVRVDPAGTIQSKFEVKYPKDGGWELTQHDGRGVLAGTIRMKDGIETHLARSGSPFIDGCARLALKFDDKGDIVQRTCQSASGHVIIDASGCPSLRFEHNDQHQVVVQRCVQEDGTAMVASSGVHMWRVTYDDKGRQTEASNFGLNDIVVINSAGCARNRFDHDDAGNVVSELCIGPTGMPIPFPNTSAAGQLRSYDAHGCMTKEVLVDVDGKPALVGSYAGRTFARDTFCAETMVQTIDGAGAPLATSGSIARIERSFDEQGNATEQRCFDPKHQPANCAGEKGKAGTTIRFTYDERGLIVSEKAFDDAGKPTATSSGYPHEVRKVWDEKGQLTEERYFGTDGTPATALKTVAHRVFKLDALGASSGFSHFGLDGRPVVDETGVHEVKRLFDDKHRVAGIELYDDKGQLTSKSAIIFEGIPWPTNAAKLVIVRDGVHIKNDFYDRAGNKMKSVDCDKPEVSCSR